jgi:hypothetical protein
MCNQGISAFLPSVLATETWVQTGSVCGLDLQDQGGETAYLSKAATATEKGEKEEVEREGRAEAGLVKRAEAHRDAGKSITMLSQ